MPDLDPAQVAALDEARWYAEAYRGDQPQLTARAVVTGLALGFVLAFANVYIGLTTGWFFGMALAACLASFAIWRGFAWLGLARTPLTILETNCMQSTASAAAYATGNMLVGIVPAMLLLSVTPAAPRGTQLPAIVLIVWIACIAALGVVLAIPLKRQLIDRERLPFPSGTAAAVMLHGLYRGAAVRARGVLGALGLGALLPVLRDLHGVALLPARLRVLDWLPGKASELGLVLEPSILLPAAGAFAGLRTTLAMLLGGLLTAFVLGPIARTSLWIDPTGHAVLGATSAGRVWLDAGIWLGAPLLAAYALVALAGSWRAFGRLVRRTPAGPSPHAHLEVPARWFWIGFALTGTAAIALARAWFGIPIALGVLAVAMSLVFSSVACRINGETDIQPGAAMGKLTQLVFGGLRPQHPTTNLLTAAMTHASSVAAADLLNDLKSGYLLGAHPRRQVIAQALGITAGAVASVLAYFVLVPDATALAPGPDGVARFAAPGAHQFRAIAELLQYGLAHLHPLHRELVVIGAIAGVVLAIAERLAGKRGLSTAGLGLGLLLPLSTSLAMLLGAIIAALAQRRGSTQLWPLAAGALAGESIAGVAVALANSLTG